MFWYTNGTNIESTNAYDSEIHYTFDEEIHLWHCFFCIFSFSTKIGNLDNYSDLKYVIQVV